MIYTITSQHTLQSSPFHPSPNIGDLFPAGLPDTIVLHYTASSDAARDIHMLCDPEREVSAHLVIDREGNITQLVPFNTIAWHAGKSSWSGRESLNKYSIGIEIVNAGPLSLYENKFYTWDKIEIDKKEVEPRINKDSKIEYWHKYPKSQIHSVKLVCLTLISHYQIKEILAHSEIAPDRKIDPGPAFPLQTFKDLTHNTKA